MRSGQTVAVAVPLAPQLGTFSYFIGADVEKVRVGQAVQVPFGERQDWGLVVGAGEVEKAEREILAAGAVLLSSSEVALATWAAERWCGLESQTVLRAVPREILREAATGRGRGRENLDPWGGERPRRQYRICAPGLEMAGAGGEEVEKLLAEQSGRVLVLCATQEMVSAVTAALERRGGNAAGSVAILEGSSLAAAEEGFGRGRKRGRVLVGTRHHGLWPVRNLGAVVVVEAEHPGHRAQSQPYTHSRDLAIRRALLEGAGCVVLDRVPSPAGLWGGLRVVETGSKQKHWPKMETLRYNPGAGGGFGSRIREAVKVAVTRGESVAVVYPGGEAGWVCQQCRAEWTCRRCETWVRVGGCECAERPDARTCAKCRSRSRVIRGWDPERVRRELGVDPGEELGVAVLSRAEMWGGSGGRFGMVVLVEADDGGVGGTDPGLEATRMMVETARQTAPGGRLLLHNVRRGGAVEAVVRSRAVYGVVKRSWENARDDGLAPFGREVRVAMTGPRPERPDWSLRTFGPKKTTDGWELLVRCQDEDLAEVRSWVEEERRARRRKLRITVT